MTSNHLKSSHMASSQLPPPSSTHATCAWCRCDFPSIVALLTHVDQGHTIVKAA